MSETNSLNQQISIYKELMHSLIYEKPNGSKEKIAHKQELLKQLAAEKFTIIGDETFKFRINEYLKDILSVKPGRKLIKALLQSDQKIRVIEDNRFFFNGSDEITVKSFRTDDDYTTIGERCFRKPNWVNFAHELIHALHYSRYSEEEKRHIYCEKNLIKKMDDWEEQRTIVGFDDRTFSLKEVISKLDIICENAFLLALGLPPRIDHQGGVGEELNWDVHKDNDVLNTYLKWLENAVNSYRQIPAEKAYDKEYILEFVYKNPIAASTMSDELKADEQFMLELMTKDTSNIRSLLKQFPKWHQNKEFMLKLIKKYDVAVLYLNPSHLDEKGYVIKCLDLAGEEEILLKSIDKKLRAELKDDPEIKKYFENYSD